MPSIDVCPRCHGDGILRSTGDGTLRRKGDGTALRRSGGAIDCPHCGGLGRLVSVTDAGKAGQISESLRAMMWPYTIHLQLAQRELFEAAARAAAWNDRARHRHPGLSDSAKAGAQGRGAAERRAVLASLRDSKSVDSKPIDAPEQPAEGEMGIALRLAASLRRSRYKDEGFRALIRVVLDAGADALGAEIACNVLIEELFGLDNGGPGGKVRQIRQLAPTKGSPQSGQAVILNMPGRRSVGRWRVVLPLD
jgi:hypothetical protein